MLTQPASAGAPFKGGAGRLSVAKDVRRLGVVATPIGSAATWCAEDGCRTLFAIPRFGNPSAGRTSRLRSGTVAGNAPIKRRAVETATSGRRQES